MFIQITLLFADQHFDKKSYENPDKFSHSLQ